MVNHPERSFSKSSSRNSNRSWTAWRGENFDFTHATPTSLEESPIDRTLAQIHFFAHLVLAPERRGGGVAVVAADGLGRAIGALAVDESRARTRAGASAVLSAAEVLGPWAFVLCGEGELTNCSGPGEKERV